MNALELHSMSKTYSIWFVPAEMCHVKSRLENPIKTHANILQLV